MLAIPRSPDARARTMRVLVLPALFSMALAWLLVGCGGHMSDANAPVRAFRTDSPFGGGGAPAPSGEGIGASLSDYPLAVGNRWDYILASRIEIYPTSGAPSATNGGGRWRTEVVDHPSASEYFTVLEGDPESLVSGIFYQRKDADGLFEYDPGAVPASGSVPDPLALTRRVLATHERSLTGMAHEAEFELAAKRATEKLAMMRRWLDSGALATTQPAPHEITLLRFPVHTGASWTVRTSPYFGRVVVRQDELMLPVGRVRAWRVQGLSDLFGPDDRVYFWYGRVGLARVHLHAVVEATDVYGNPIGDAIAEFDQSLAQVRRVGDPGPTK